MDYYWYYALVFVAAATPFIEIVLVIPAALLMGLSPWLVAVISFVGNAIPVFLIIGLFRRLYRDRFVNKRFSLRAMRIWRRFGLPGLALAAPGVTGIHLAVIMALVLDASHRATAFWMCLSLLLWTIATTLITLGGMEGWQWLKS